MEGWWAASYVVLWLLVASLSVVVVALARQIGSLHLRLGPRGALEVDSEGPPLGEAPEAVDLVDVAGRLVAIGGPGEAQLLLFVSPGCRLCEQVLPGVSAVARAGDLVPYVVADADPQETAATFGERKLGAAVVAGGTLARDYQVPGTPYAVALDRTGVVMAKGTINNLEQMEGLVDTAKRRKTEHSHERQAS